MVGCLVKVHVHGTCDTRGYHSNIRYDISMNDKMEAYIHIVHHDQGSEKGPAT